MSIALIAGGSVHYAHGSTGAVDTSSLPMDTTGANLIVVGVVFPGTFPPSSISDNKSNTYTPLTAQDAGLAACLGVGLYYCANPTVGSGHYFSLNGSAASPRYIAALAFSGANTTPFDDENGTAVGTAATSVNTGTVDPTEDNEVIVSVIGVIGDGVTGGSDAASDITFSIGSSFTKAEEQDWSSSWTPNAAMGYLIQTTAASVNPQWSWGANFNRATAIATFKAAGTGPLSGQMLEAADVTDMPQTVQILKPASDISNAGAYTCTSGSDLYAMLDEDTADGITTYIRSPDNPSSAVCEIEFNAGNAFSGGFGMLGYQLWQSGSGTQCLVQLYCNTTLIDSWTETGLDTSPKIYSHYLSPAVVATIADPAHMRLRFTAS